MNNGHLFTKVKTPNPWRKLSIALWPKDAGRNFRASFDLTHAQIFKASTNTTWTQILSYAFVQTLKELPQKQLFIHGYCLKTRSNIDLFIRMSVRDESNEDSVWSMYFRCLQDLSYSEFIVKFNSLKEKYSNPTHRMPFLGVLIKVTPILILMGLIKLIDVLLRFGIPVPFMHRYAYPSISISNLGSVGTPETEMLGTPLCYPPLSIAIGEVSNQKVDMMIRVDHRIFDGKDVGVFLRQFQKTLNQII